MEEEEAFSLIKCRGCQGCGFLSGRGMETGGWNVLFHYPRDDDDGDDGVGWRCHFKV